MPHTIYHCGSAGENTGERDIKIYTGSVMDYAVRLSPHDMQKYGVSEREMEEFERLFEKHKAKLVAKLRRLGIPYQYHVPHAENFKT